MGMNLHATIPLPKLANVPWPKVLLWAAIIAFAFFIWPTPWKEYKSGSANVRVNRFTGNVQHLGSDGWDEGGGYGRPGRRF